MQGRGRRVADDRARAIAAQRAGRNDEARAAYMRLLARNPKDAGIWTNLGVLLRESGAHDLALVAQKRALALAPHNRAILNNAANSLNDSGESERSLVLRRALIAQEPDNPAHRAMEGRTLRALVRYDEGIEVLEAALAEHADDAELRVQLALTQLAAGHYAGGFQNYAARWQTDELTPRQMSTPKWDGGPLDGKTLLVLPEQGLGDALAFARFLPVLRRFGPDRVLLQCARPLARLMIGIDGADWTGTDPRAAGAHDVWTDLMDLPALRFAASKAIPPPARLTIPDDSRRRARAMTAPYRDRFRIGVNWGGSVTYRGDAFRSFSHRQYHRLLDLPQVQMFSLYKGSKLADYHADGSAAFILDAASTDRDLADTAAMMAQMDLIVTSCTATAHLAGTLGLPVWTLLHWEPFWLWQIAQDETPWYPSMRLVRQSRAGDWDGVFAQVHDDLKQRLSDWRKAD